MSKIQLDANASGTGVFTIASPDSNTDRTITLPDQAGTVITTQSPQLGRRNLIINGAMQVAQRGTSSAAHTTSYGCVDRFTVYNSIGALTFSQDTDAPDGFSNSIKLLCTTADASPSAGGYTEMQQVFEGQNLQHLKKGTPSALTVTLSFWVKSNKTGTYQVNFIDSDNTRIVNGSYTIDTADTWEYKTVSYIGDTSGSLDNDNNLSMRVDWWFGSGSDFNSGTYDETWKTFVGAEYAAGLTVNLNDAVNNYINITGVQLEVGDTATDFEHRSYGEELALCQRYCHVLNTANDRYNHIGTNYLSTHCYFKVQYPVVMRAAPSATQNTISASAYSAGGTVASYTSVTINNSFTLSSQVLISISGTAGYVSHVDLQGGQLTFDAEL